MNETMRHYELINEKYGNEKTPVTIDELRDLLTNVFGDRTTELVERSDGIYELESGEMVAVMDETMRNYMNQVFAI